MMQISFGKKNPIIQCNIKDTNKNKLVPAKIFEYDCQCSSDVEDVLYMGSDWYYNFSIACDMQNKYETENFKDEKSPKHFYVMENQNGLPVALCETQETDSEIQVEYIETKHNSEQKYCGQTMLAALGKKVLDLNLNKLVIVAPLRDVYNFYTTGCGFEQSTQNHFKLEMKPEKIKEFIDKTQKKTNGEIIDIKA